MEDNFFSLNDSVLAIKLVAAARSTSLDLSLEIMFEHPVLSDMATITKSLTAKEQIPTEIAAFSLLDGTSDIHQVLREASKQCSICRTIYSRRQPLHSYSSGVAGSFNEGSRNVYLVVCVSNAGIGGP